MFRNRELSLKDKSKVFVFSNLFYFIWICSCNSQYGAYEYSKKSKSSLFGSDFRRARFFNLAFLGEILALVGQISWCIQCFTGHTSHMLIFFIVHTKEIWPTRARIWPVKARFKNLARRKSNPKRLEFSLFGIFLRSVVTYYGRIIFTFD